MIDVFTMQVSFLIFEAAFCFLAALVYAASKDSLRMRKRIVIALNIACGAMLLCEYLFYVYKGSSTPVDVVIMYLVNAAVYYLVVILLFLYAMLISVRLFERFDIKKDMPCRKRIIAVCLIVMLGLIMVTVSQFTGIYYYFDANNVYQRGPFFWLSSIIPMAGTFLVASIVFQYRAQMTLSQLFVLMSYLILPLAGGLFQILFYGNSLLNICIGLSVLMMFFENVVNKEKEVIKAYKIEARTGLANEHGYIEWLNSMKGKPELKDYAVVVFDLRKFGDINRRYGIENGNRILASFGNIMMKHIEKDEILGRQFGNQFVAMVKKYNLRSLMDILKEIVVPFNDVFTDKEEKAVLSARVGIYMMDRTDLVGEDILIFAGQALIKAKSRDNEDVVWLTQDLIDTIAENKKLESDMRKGLKNKEFRPFYQPKVDIKTGTMCGAEALSRWYNNGEILAPGRFIHVMESSDIICTMDFCILKAVCEDISGWLKAGLQVPPVSVNFSRRNLEDPNLAKQINSVIEGYGIPKELIEIEVTENRDRESIFVLKQFVDSLHEFGYRVSIDDFGSASSSLTLLREIPFDTLKIDKGFVDNFEKRDLVILTNIVKMAMEIPVDIVAEGVEQDEQLKILDNLGVKVIQGFYFDRPLSKEDMTGRIKSPVYNIGG